MKKEKSDYRGIYSEMVEILGEEIVMIIHKHYKGQQISLPIKLYSDNYIRKYIIENYEKKSNRELARELGYSDRWVNKLVNKIKQEIENERE